MNNKGSVSVIIPVYNVEQYLRECVDSVLRQTYQNFEIILVDDGSKDGSPKICDEYAGADRRIQVIHQENQGLSIARNNGFSASSGEFVYFLDSDDWIEPNTLELLLETAREANAQMVFFDAVSFLDDGDICTAQRYQRAVPYEADKGLRVLNELQKNKDYHSAVPMLFLQRDFLSDHQLTFYPGIVYEDMVYTFQAYCLADCAAHVNKALYHRRYRSNSITSVKRTKKNFVSSKTVYDIVSAFVEKNGLQNDTTNTYIRRCALNALNIYEELEPAEKRECAEQYAALKKSILFRKAFGSKALRARCHGKLPWMMVKGMEKVGLLKD